MTRTRNINVVTTVHYLMLPYTLTIQPVSSGHEVRVLSPNPHPACALPVRRTHNDPNAEYCQDSPLAELHRGRFVFLGLALHCYRI